MKFLRSDEYIKIYMSLPGDIPWYLKYFGVYPRAFVFNKVIYVNDGAIYINTRDYNLLIRHEVGHTRGLSHTWTGVMCPYGIVRYLTTWK